MFELALEYQILLFAAVPVYWLSWRNLFKSSLDSHTHRVEHGYDPNSYPTAYYRWLMIQLVPLSLLGMVRLDAFIIGTRIVLLFAVAICYVMVQDEDGKFTWKEYGRGLMAWAISISVGFMAFIQFRGYEFLTEHAVEYGYVMMAVMALYMVFGQGATLLKLVQNRKVGGTRTAGLQLQSYRCAGFGLPAIHYGMAHGLTDSLFVVNLLGMFGACALISVYLATPVKK